MLLLKNNNRMKQIQIIGNLGQNSKVANGSNGRELTTFSVAVSNRQNTTTWFSVCMRRNDKLDPYLVKGTKVFVQGDLEPVLYNGGIQLNVFAERVELAGGGTMVTPQESTPSEQSTQTHDTSKGDGPW